MFSALSPADLDALDAAALKAMILAQQESYEAQQHELKTQHEDLRAQHDQQTAVLNSRATEIERLVLLVAKLQHMLFGRKSEKVLRQIEQMEFQLEDLQAGSVVEEAQLLPSTERQAPAKPFRRPLPEHLPREVHTHMPAHEACPDCGGRLRELGEDVAEMLEYVRASFKVLRHVRPKLSCDRCDCIVQAPACDLQR
jgi:transposase